jgi:RNA polymerase sigma-70 factor (ECF subfamily)
MLEVEGIVLQDELSDRERANQAMERYADGDDGAFSDLYDVLAPRLHRFALGLTGAGPAAEDVVQQTLMQLHLARDRFARGAPVLPFAYAIARNLVRDEARKRTTAEEARARTADAQDQPPMLLPDAALDLKRREKALNEALRELPEGLRAPFLLVHVEGLSIGEVAQALGMTQGNVKVRVHRARRMLIEIDEGL